MYEYDAECPDKLTKFDGNAIEYNSIGCPSKYKDEDYEWANGKLSKIHRSTVIRDDEHYTTRTFTYDGYGRRTQKYSISGVNLSGEDAVNSYSWSQRNDYTYDNSGRLIREVYTRRDSSGTVSETRELVYLYDESGMIGVMYNSQPYYYHRNLQGDVIAIYDANGEKQVEYAYDAWGNCEIVYGENSNLASLNPIRYRGYYYDTETGLYYLNARYYSPEWRRFISPDAAEYIDPETPNGLNLYAYCNNDPVNYADPSGHSIILALIFAGTFAVGFGSSLLINAATNNWQLDWRDFAQAGIDGLFAVAGTALAMTGICAGVSIGLGAAMGWSQYAIGTKIQGGNLTLSGSITAIAFGALGGIISGPGATNVQNVADNLIGLSDDGLRAAKAIATAMNRRMAGQISKRGFQGVINLYGKTAFSAIDAAIPGTSRMLFMGAAKKLAFYTPFANIASGGLGYLYNVWGWI